MQSPGPVVTHPSHKLQSDAVFTAVFGISKNAAKNADTWQTSSSLQNSSVRSHSCWVDVSSSAHIIETANSLQITALASDSPRAHSVE